MTGKTAVQDILQNMEPRLEKTYSQRIPALQRYVTKFEWVLPDWTLLYNTTYSKGLKSDSFPLQGIDRCTCQLFLNLKDEGHHVHILFSDPASILAVKIIIQINEQVPNSFSFSQPVTEIRRLGISVLKEKKEICDVLCIDSSKEANDTVTILANFVVTKFPEPSFCKNLAERGIWAIPSADVLYKFRALFENRKLCDVTFVLGSVEIPAHKIILAAHSKVFKAMFSRAMTENEESEVEIVDIDADVFEEFLDYLYMGEVYLSDDSIEEMIILADKYKVTELKKLCENYMLEDLCVENVAQYIITADKLHCTELKKKLLKFIKNNSSAFEKVIQEGDLEVSRSLKKIKRFL